MCSCRYCNHYFWSVSRRAIEDSIVDHQSDKHPDELLDFHIIPIPASQYLAYLRDRVMPNFWSALRNVKKSGVVEARLEALKERFG
jgi:hypothetical protein